MNKISNEKFSIRKYKLGAASVLLGTVIVVGGLESKTAQASEQTELENRTAHKTNHQGQGETVSPKVMSEQSSEIQEESLKVSPEGSTSIETKPNNNIAESTQTSTKADELQSLTESKPKIKTEAKHDQMTTVQSQNNLKEKVDQAEHVTMAIATEKTSVEVKEGQSEQPANVNGVVSEQKNKVSEAKAFISPRINNVAQPTPSSNKAYSESVSHSNGVDVTNKVIAKDDSQIISENVVNPHQGHRSQLKYNLEFGKGIKSGDYFDFVLSNNVNTNGVSTRKKVPDIKNGSIVMATGQVLENGRIRYTFTDYITGKVNVTAKLSLNLFIDPKVVLNDSQETIKATLNGKEVAKVIDVQYLRGVNNAGIGINGVIESLDKEQSKFSHIAYINTQGNTIQSATIHGRITNGYTTNGPLPTVKVYEYIGKDALAQSVYADTNDASKWKDVTNEVKNMLTISESQYQLHFETLNKRYVIRYEGTYQNDAQNLNFQTNVSGYPEYYPNYNASATWNNGLVFYQSDANGQGDSIIIDNNDINWHEDTLPEGESGHNNGDVEEEDSHPIDWEEGSASEGDGGHNNGDVEEEDSHPIDWEEGSASEGDGGHNNGDVEEEDSNPIDWEENTTPEGDGGHNNGDVEEEDSHPIDWEENTTPDGDGGHNNGDVEEEDSHPIDWEENTTPDGDGGHNNGEIEEEDTHPIDWEEDMTPEEESEGTTPNERNKIIKPNVSVNHVDENERKNIKVQNMLNNTNVKMNNSNTQILIKTQQQMKRENNKTISELPETGEKAQPSTLFATLLALLGTALLFKRNRKNAK